jgi:hypothetical protein
MSRAAAAALAGCTAIVGTVVATAAAAPAPTSQTAPQTAPPPPPAVTPQHGRPFTPTQGDWEGMARGFAASFQLGLDPGSGRYVLTRLVLLRPNACPVDPARHSEFFLRSPARVALGSSGSLRFGSAGVSTALRGAGAAILTSTYRTGTCAGTLTWRMRPARRVAVDDGAWTIRFGGDAPARFRVGSGGRLARAIPLPAVPTGCSGLRGALDLFISASGRSTLAQSGVAVAMRFGPRTATGTLRIAGCRAGSLRISASALR